MQEEIKQKIDKKISSDTDRYLNKDWFYNFFEILNKSGYKGNLDEIVDLVLKNPKLIYYNDSKEPLRYILHFPVCKKRGEALLSFLQSKLTGTVLENQMLLDEMFEFIKVNSTEETFFGNLMIKFLSLKFANEIQIDAENSDLKNPDEDLLVHAKLGEFNIAILEASYFEGVGIKVHTIFTIKELTSQRLGSILMQRFFRILNKDYPEQEDLIVGNVVRNNVGAQRFYEKLGGEFYSPDGEPISREKIQSVEDHSSVYVIYDKKSISDLANAEDVKPLSMDEFKERQKKAEEAEKEENEKE